MGMGTLMFACVCMQVLPDIVAGLGYDALTNVVISIANFIQLGYRRNLSHEFTEADLDDITEALRVRGSHVTALTFIYLQS